MNANQLADAALDAARALRARGQLAEAIASIGEAARLAPARRDIVAALGEALHAQALRLLTEGHTDAGAGLLRQFVQLRPHDAAAQLNLAEALRVSGDGAGATAVLAALVATGAAMPGAELARLALVLMQAGAAPEAEAAALRALAASGAAVGVAQPDLLVALGMARHQQGNLDGAAQAYRAALALAPSHSAAHANLAMIDLARGDLVRGFAGFEWRRTLGRQPPPEAPPALPDLASLAGQRVVLHGEQGHGDTIQFVRFAPALVAAGAQVTLRVQPRLVRLLGGMAGMQRVMSHDDPAPPADHHLPLVSLTVLLGTTLARIPAAPYLAAAPAAVAHWRARLAGLPGLKVGLAWAGDDRASVPSARAMNARRSIPLAALAPLGGIAGISLVSLQRGNTQPVPPGMVLHDWTAEEADLADTAAVIGALDLVVSVDTAIAHLAGALGHPVWLLNRAHGDWRWLLDRDDSPWYPSLHQFRQVQAGDWDAVVVRLVAALSRAAATGLAPGSGFPPS